MLVSGSFLYLFAAHMLSSNLFEAKGVGVGEEHEDLWDYLGAKHRHLFEQVMGAFFVTLAAEFIAWNSIIGLSIDPSNAILFFLAFGGFTALLLFLIFERLPFGEDR